MLKISRLDINLPADLVQTCAGVRESQLCKFIATNSQGEFQHSIEVRGKQNNVISLELSNLSISFQDGHFVAEVEQALKVFQGRSETENEAVIPDAHVTSSQNAELESSHSNSGQPPDQVTLQDHYVSQVPMATNVTQGHQPTPEPSPRRLFRNISRKRPAETVTSGATKFPRIIQEERLPSLTSGTTTTALTQQTHSDTKQTEEVSVEESRHDIVEVKVETDDDDYEDLTGAIDDNTGDSANKPSSSYVHSVPMVSQALASQHVVLGHSSSSTGHHTGQHTAVQQSGQAIARRQEQVKIDEQLIRVMTDEQIEEYVPTFGDRIAQSTLVGEQCEEGEETSTQSSQSKEEGILERLQEEFRQKFLKEKKSSRYESLHGNQNAKKNIRRIELGWLHKEWGKGFTQVKSQNGGGTRHLTIPCDMKMKDLKQVAMDLFFEHGQSGKGAVSDFHFKMCHFSKKEIDEECTVRETYDKKKVKLLRVYLATYPKD